MVNYDGEKTNKSKLHILDIVDIDNLVPELEKTALDKIGADVVSDYDVDKRSMKDWIDRNDLALKLIDQKQEAKNDPWPGSASTKLPLVLNAAMKASAEEYTEIMRGNELVKTQVFGKSTPDKELRAERVAKRMNFQFYHELKDWEEDHDRLIMVKNIVGTVHKKYFYGDGEIQCVLRHNGVVINDNVMHLDDAPRITDEVEKFWWQAEEKFRSGEWEEIELTDKDSEDFAQNDRLNLFLEQIRREDLDGDGYPEPYIVTVHKQTKQVVRITPNFTPESVTFNEKIDMSEYEGMEEDDKKAAKKGLSVIKVDNSKSRIKYVKYEMIPSWEGGYWGFGYGILLGPLNENCNQTINHLLNAGHLANMGGGFINSGIKLASGELKFRMNEWKRVQSSGMDLSRNIVHNPVKEPSQTLFALLGLLMDVLRELSSVTEVMSGEQPRANMPAASILALIEQGKKLFNSIYKRHYRSLGKEQLALFDLNFLYQNPERYAEFHDLKEGETALDPKLWMSLVQSDFERDGLDVLPTANPEFSSRMQRMAESQALLELKDDPRVDGSQIIRRFVEGVVDDQDIAKIIVPEQPQMSPGQIIEEMQVKTEEFLESNKARISEAEAKEAEIRLQMTIVEAKKQGIKLPLDIEKLALSVEKAEVAVENERAKRDTGD